MGFTEKQLTVTLKDSGCAATESEGDDLATHRSRKVKTSGGSDPSGELHTKGTLGGIISQG